MQKLGKDTPIAWICDLGFRVESRREARSTDWLKHVHNCCTIYVWI